MFPLLAGPRCGGSALSGESQHQLYEGQRHLRAEEVPGAAQVSLHVRAQVSRRLRGCHCKFTINMWQWWPERKNLYIKACLKCGI